MKDSERHEWRNYRATRRGIGSGAAASLQVARAVVARLRRRRGRPMVRPAYLSIADVLAASQDGAVPAARRASPSAAHAEPVPKELQDWAEGYRDAYQQLAEGGGRLSPDPEDYWTAHQFGWLLALVLAGEPGIADRAGEYIKRWIERFGAALDDPAWRSFSISERLSNWVQLLKLIDPGPAWPAIAESMRAQAVHLAARLEGQTEGGGANNHLISNGRGLYVTGAFLGLDGLTRLGRRILVEEARRQFTADGFLDEGSSHYQLIVTRDYLEALEMARACGDTQATEALSPPVDSMLRACAFFRDERSAEWLIPFIGDISPDPPPLFFDTRMGFWEFPRRIDRGWTCYPASGFFRWSGERFVAWWHARGAGKPRRHAHNDWGSFQLHVDGEPVFIDPGRSSYRDGETGYDARLTLAQNSLAVDGFEQALFLKRELFVPEYLDDTTKVEWSGDQRAGRLSIGIDAYRRLREPVAHNRTFSVNVSGMAITDMLAGEGRHTATAAFHLHPGIRAAATGDGTFLLTTPRGRRARFAVAPGGTVSEKRGGARDTPGGYCSVEYGTLRETTSIFAEYSFLAALTLEHRIDVE